jgi:hypothetical protein
MKRQTRKQAISVPFQHRHDASRSKLPLTSRYENQPPAAISITAVWASLIAIHVFVFAYLDSEV